MAHALRTAKRHNLHCISQATAQAQITHTGLDMARHDTTCYLANCIMALEELIRCVQRHVKHVKVCRRLSLSNSAVPTMFSFTFYIRVCAPRAQNTTRVQAIIIASLSIMLDHGRHATSCITSTWCTRTGRVVSCQKWNLGLDGQHNWLEHVRSTTRVPFAPC